MFDLKIKALDTGMEIVYCHNIDLGFQDELQKQAELLGASILSRRFFSFKSSKSLFEFNIYLSNLLMSNR